MSNTTNFKKSLLATASLAALSVTSFKAVGADINTGTKSHTTEGANSYNFTGDATLDIDTTGTSISDITTDAGNTGTANFTAGGDFSVSNKVGDSKALKNVKVSDGKAYTISGGMNTNKLEFTASGGSLDLGGASTVSNGVDVGHSNIDNSIILNANLNVYGGDTGDDTNELNHYQFKGDHTLTFGNASGNNSAHYAAIDTNGTTQGLLKIIGTQAIHKSIGASGDGNDVGEIVLNSSATLEPKHDVYTDKLTLNDGATIKIDSTSASNKELVSANAATINNNNTIEVTGSQDYTLDVDLSSNKLSNLKTSLNDKTLTLAKAVKTSGLEFAHDDAVVDVNGAGSVIGTITPNNTSKNTVNFAENATIDGSVASSGNTLKEIKTTADKQITFDNSEGSSSIDYYVDDINANASAKSKVTIKAGSQNATFHGNIGNGAGADFGAIEVDAQNENSLTNITGNTKANQLDLLAKGKVKLNGGTIGRVIPHEDGVNELQIGSDTTIGNDSVDGRLDEVADDSTRTALKTVKFDGNNVLTLTHKDSNSSETYTISPDFITATNEEGAITLNKGNYKFTGDFGTAQKRLESVNIDATGKSFEINGDAYLKTGIVFNSNKNTVTLGGDVTSASSNNAINFSSSDNEVAFVPADDHDQHINGIVAVGSDGTGSLNLKSAYSVMFHKNVGDASATKLKSIKTSEDGKFVFRGVVYTKEVQFNSANGKVQVDGDSSEIDQVVASNGGNGKLVINGNNSTVKNIGQNDNAVGSIRVTGGNALTLDISGQALVNSISTTSSQSTLSLDDGGSDGEIKGSIVANNGTKFSEVEVSKNSNNHSITGDLVATTLKFGAGNKFTVGGNLDVTTVDFGSVDGKLHLNGKDQEINTVKGNTESSVITMNNGGVVNQSIGSSTKFDTLTFSGGSDSKHYKLKGNLTAKNVTFDTGASVEVAKDITVDGSSSINLTNISELDLNDKTLTLNNNDATVSGTNNELNLVTKISKHPSQANKNIIGNISNNNLSYSSGTIYLTVKDLDQVSLIDDQELTVANGSNLNNKTKFASNGVTLEDDGKTLKFSPIKTLKIKDESDVLKLVSNIKKMNDPDAVSSSVKKRLNKLGNNFFDGLSDLVKNDQKDTNQEVVKAYENMQSEKEIENNVRKQANTNQFMATIKESSISSAAQVADRADSLATGISGGQQNMDVSVWTQGNFNYLNKNKAYESDFNSNTIGGGIVFGLEGNYAKNTFGVAVPIHSNKTTFDESDLKKNDELTVKSVGGNAYGVHHLSNFALNWYAGGISGWLDSEASRTPLRGNPEGKNRVDNQRMSTFNGGFGIAYNYRVDENIIIAPIGKVDGNKLFGTSLKETEPSEGEGNQGLINKYTDIQSKFLLASIGVKFAGDFNAGGNNFVPSLRASYKGDLTENDHAKFTVNGAGNLEATEPYGIHYGEFEGALDSKFGDHFDLNASVKWTFSLDNEWFNYNAVRGSIKVKYTF